MLLQPLAPNRPQRRVSREATVPAPVEGWDASSPLASMDPKRAVELENIFPQPGWVEVRRGSAFQAWDIGTGAVVVSSIDTGTDEITVSAHTFTDGDVVKVDASTTMPGGLTRVKPYYIINSTATTFQLSLTSGGSAVDITSGGTGTIAVYSLENRPAVETLMPYHGPGATQKLFAAAGGAIWDVTSTSYARYATGGSFGLNRWQHTNFATSGGNFLFLVNGTDAPRYFDGSSWTVPTITGTGITATDFITVTPHKSRLWFAIKNTTDAAYLGSSAIAGTAVKFPLGPVFSKGGYLVTVETWTMDGGAGPDDYCVFISSRGQAAVYAGTDPASASTWALVGVFDIGEPIGRRCSVRYGTSPLIISRSGLLKLQLSLAQDRAEMNGTAYTARIYQAMSDAARSYGANFGWQAVSYPRGNMLILNVPTAESTTSEQFVMNTLHGAWCKFTGWNANCFAVFNDNLYFGSSNGTVYQGDIGSSDVGEDIVAQGQTAYRPFGSTGANKRFTMLKALVRSTATNRPQLGISTDFVETSNLSVLPANNDTGALWDVARWDEAEWSSDDVPLSDWASTVAHGVWGSIKFVTETGSGQGGSLWGVALWGEDEWGYSTADETMRINGFVVVFETGGYL